MSPREPISFIRYLEAKKSVDDRSLNSRVWENLAKQLSQSTPGYPLMVIEAGAGIGTMLERMLETGLLQEAHYTGFDNEPANIAHARARLPVWAGEHGFKVESLPPDRILLDKPPQRIRAEFRLADFLAIGLHRQNWASYDLLIANAFLDSLPFRC